MKAARKITLLSLVVLCCLIVFGCSKDDEGAPSTPPTAPDKPTVKVNAEIAKMDVTQLRTAALKCKAALDAKTAETEKKAQELIKSLASNKPEERTKLNVEMTELNKAAEALGKQLDAYVTQFKAKGGDVSELGLDE